MENTLHFTLGKDFGITLTQIAQEHIQYNYDLEKGINTIAKGLIGIPTDIVLKIIKGDYVIEVSPDGKNVSVRTERSEKHSKYPIFDISSWSRDKYISISDNGAELRKALIQVSEKFKNINNFSIEIPLASMRSLFSGTLNGDEALNYLLQDQNVSSLNDVLKLTKNYSETSLKIHQTIVGLLNAYNGLLSDEEKEIINSNQCNALEYLNDINYIVQQISDLNFNIDEDYCEELNNYVTSANEIKNVLSKAIEPVNILDNYSAGWLAPNGDFYGLNGEIANMLHNQIADALFDAGIIVNNEENHFNPDSFLSQTGWIRIHGDNIQFEGNLNHRILGHDVKITDIQIKKVYEYGQLCCNGILSIGWKREKISAARFRDIAEINYDYLIKQYFDF